MSILAIDAGFTAMGWALVVGREVVKVGCIRTRPPSGTRKREVRVASQDVERTQFLARKLRTVINENAVAGMVVELPGGGAKGARANACMARAGAVVATLAELMGLPTEWVAPLDAKSATGVAKAQKEDVARMVLGRWPDVAGLLPPSLGEREHILDALGAYIAAEGGLLVRTLNAEGTQGADTASGERQAAPVQGP